MLGTSSEVVPFKATHTVPCSGKAPLVNVNGLK